MSLHDRSGLGPNLDVEDLVVIRPDQLNDLIARLGDLGYETKGPTIGDGAIVPGAVRGTSDLPVGARDAQSPGRYRLEYSDDGHLFEWAVGARSWKAEFFAPRERQWRAVIVDGTLRFTEPTKSARPLAIIGARPCEVAAISVLDEVLMNGACPDTGYDARREGLFVVVAECTAPGGTCFCASMGSGPSAGPGFDLALLELDDADGHRFVVRVGTARGAEVMAGVSSTSATDADVAARAQALDRSINRMHRHLQTEGLAALLARSMKSPRWDQIAERCLSCGNCTLVCPTCFCSDFRDTTDVSGAVERTRTWSSCFDLDHSYLHGGPVRASTSSRYRQWMSHKLSTWWDQFDTSGCVGCGRCITWCPVGIDITEEAAAIRGDDEAGRAVHVEEEAR
jgi:ferredoxin